MSGVSGARTRLVALLARQQLGYSVSPEGDFFVEFAGADFPSLVVRLTPRSSTVSVLAFLACLYSPEWEDVLRRRLASCGAPAAGRRAYVAVDSIAQNGSSVDVAVFIEEQVRVGRGDMTEAALNAWWWQFVEAADDLLTSLYRCIPDDSVQLPSVQELEMWFGYE